MQEPTKNRKYKYKTKEIALVAAKKRKESSSKGLAPSCQVVLDGSKLAEEGAQRMEDTRTHQRRENTCTGTIQKRH